MQTSSFKISWDNPHAIRISRGPYRQKGKGGQPAYRDLWPSLVLFNDWTAAVESGREKEFEPEYTERYNRQLAMLSPQKVYSDLVALQGADAVLLCHCDPGAFCHRRLVANWLQDELGINVPELVV